MKIKNRLTNLLARKNNNLLSIFITAGYPALDSTVPLCKMLEEQGVDFIELGMPFSDPIADGVVIQEASNLAIDNGINISKVLEIAKEINKTTSLPIILMGYYNPVFKYGFDRFLKDAHSCGVDGIILPDLPIQEYEESFASIYAENHLSSIFLITSETPIERIKLIDKLTSGFIYAISSPSITGKAVSLTNERTEYLQRLNNLDLNNQIMVGFGIDSAQQLKEVYKYANGAIIGSAFIKTLQKSDNIDNAKNFLQGLKI